MSETLFARSVAGQRHVDGGDSSERIESDDNKWTRRLVLFLRIMAVVSVVQGLYHWAEVTGFVGSEEEAFEKPADRLAIRHRLFRVIELVAAVGCGWRRRGARWCGDDRGAMAVIELMFPAIYGGSLLVVVSGSGDDHGLFVARMEAARERPP